MGFRRWRPGDAAALAEAWSDGEIRRWSRVPHRGDVPTAARWIAGDAARRDALLAVDLVIRPRDGDDVWGEVGLSAIDRDRRAAMIGYWVVRAVRGRGVASEAVELASRWALGDGGLDALVARVDETNEASVAVLRRAGYVPLDDADEAGIRHFVRRRTRS